MPPLKDVTTMITAARSRHIRFTMIIQNFAQLDQVYGKENAETIRGNCGNIIYLITTELKALEEISKMCGEVKSKKDEKTASTPLVTVSDLQRMKQFEVIILRMRKQPFKTKFTPYFKLDWGHKYPQADYPQREKIPVHTFDIKEFVKAQKKKKLLEMMNAADNGENPVGGKDMFGGGFLPPMGNGNKPPFIPNRMMGNQSSVGMTSVNPFAPSSMPNMNDIPNDLSKGLPNIPGIPNTGMQEFKNPIPEITQSRPMKDNPQTKNDDLGFDVDELVRKIDAKIAELEEEERKNKEQGEKISKKQETEEKKESISVASSEPVSQKEENPLPIPQKKEETKEAPSNNLVLDDEEDDDEFFDDFFDN